MFIENESQMSDLFIHFISDIGLVGIAPGEETSFACDPNGTLYIWGNNVSG